LCGILTDISKGKEAKEQLQHMAQFDALTHLPSRALINDRLRQAIAAA
jgi:GGDEF domain-containing protein